jgi:hypothetical protein
MKIATQLNNCLVLFEKNKARSKNKSTSPHQNYPEIRSIKADTLSQITSQIYYLVLVLTKNPPKSRVRQRIAEANHHLFWHLNLLSGVTQFSVRAHAHLFTQVVFFPPPHYTHTASVTASKNKH